MPWSTFHHEARTAHVPLSITPFSPAVPLSGHLPNHSSAVRRNTGEDAARWAQSRYRENSLQTQLHSLLPPQPLRPLPLILIRTVTSFTSSRRNRGFEFSPDPTPTHLQPSLPPLPSLASISPSRENKDIGKDVNSD